MWCDLHRSHKYRQIQCAQPNTTQTTVIFHVFTEHIHQTFPVLCSTVFGKQNIFCFKILKFRIHLLSRSIVLRPHMVSCTWPCMAHEPPAGLPSSPSMMSAWTVSISPSFSLFLFFLTPCRDFRFLWASFSFHILTLSLTGKSCFSPLFKFEEMQEIVKNFTLIHIDAPGQEEGAAAYPAG